METTVYICSEMDWKSRLHNWWLRLRLKSVLQHFGLLITLMAYTVLGGLVFRQLEYPEEVRMLLEFNSTANAKREQLIGEIVKFVNNSDLTDLADLEDLVKLELKQYVKTLSEAYAVGLRPTADGERFQSLEELEKWTVSSSVFFSSSVLTTIGYGNIVPVTTKGRAFCMVFALVGIPLTLTVIADWGRLFASTVSTMMHHIPPIPGFCKQATVARRTSSYALSAICFLFVYLAAGAGLFVIWEEDWTFFDGFYFCFITMTTIGFGDLVPKKPNYMLFCTLYILIGLALTSTIIELVRRQYAQSWRQLQALSGPFAENLRKLAENAPGLDVAAFQQDLRKVLTVVTLPKKTLGQSIKGDKRKRQKELEDAVEAMIRDITEGAKTKPSPPQLVQIVIYESSV